MKKCLSPLKKACSARFNIVSYCLHVVLYCFKSHSEQFAWVPNSKIINFLK